MKLLIVLTHLAALLGVACLGIAAAAPLSLAVPLSLVAVFLIVCAMMFNAEIDERSRHDRGCL